MNWTDFIQSFSVVSMTIFLGIALSIGLLLGFFGGRLTKRPKSTPARILIDDLTSLQHEVKRVDKAVLELWKRASLPVVKRPAGEVTSYPTEANILLVGCATKLKSLADKIRRASSAIPAPLETSGATRPRKSSTELTDDSDYAHSRAYGSDSEHERDLDDLHYRSTAQNITTTMEAIDETASPGSDSISDRFLELYNRAVGDTFAREQLREEYELIRIGT